MKKPKTTTEMPVPKVKVEQPIATVATKATPKKPSSDQKTPKEVQALTPKSVPGKPEIAKPENATVAAKATPKKSSLDQKPSKEVQAVTPKLVPGTPEIAIPERVGLTAGSIWHYLTENGATPVTKLVKELTEEEKIIQRSIGWLAQEGKITLTSIDRIETIALKE
ncbi:MAG: winged helix-turn-helix domain-containing protein [Methylobacter sp.]|uniref:Winged helix-turn-helix domain-containing protein n=1 Tax=Candidatus Methylobacter titanis TaxID=3053457 RepID=A0AA43TJA9_9GAMM|nr:winged helix-turn-helix domain-containing protein [Candidatus Methylobacter titanis]